MSAGLAILASIAFAIAALFFGLWWGERGRRIAAENLLVAGTPNSAKAQRLTPPVTSEEIVRREGRPFSDETLDKATADLMGQFEAAGYKVTPEEARLRAEQMLWQAGVGGADNDDIGQFFR